MASCTIAVAIHESQLPVSNSVAVKDLRLEDEDKESSFKDKDKDLCPRTRT